jgi:hypothetical protein
MSVAMKRTSYKYLSPQQERVAQMLARGFSNKAIFWIVVSPLRRRKSLP